MVINMSALRSSAISLMRDRQDTRSAGELSEFEKLINFDAILLIPALLLHEEIIRVTTNKLPARFSGDL